ncbi:MAG: hypothetical protein IID40_04645 [Planctomycetes bacterium]|nr:hypothetical protein [Planctomycetota bacterium]
MKIVSRILAKACVVSLSVAFLAAVVGCSEQKSGSMGDNQAVGCQSKCADTCAKACDKAGGSKKCAADCQTQCCQKPAQTTAGQVNSEAYEACHGLKAKTASASGCGFKKARTASASGCGAKKAQTASATARSSGCSSKKARTAAAKGSKCSQPCGGQGVKVAKCSADCTKPCCAKKAVSSS